MTTRWYRPDGTRIPSGEPGSTPWRRAILEAAEILDDYAATRVQLTRAGFGRYPQTPSAFRNGRVVRLRRLAGRRAPMVVSTIFTGTDTEDPPRLWETAVLYGTAQTRVVGEMWRWTSREQAVAGHWAVVRMLHAERRERAWELRARGRRMSRPAPLRVRYDGARRRRHKRIR